MGKYKNEDKAAIAYNKAVDILENKGLKINYSKNYIENYDDKEYQKVYDEIKISDKLINFKLV